MRQTSSRVACEGMAPFRDFKVQHSFFHTKFENVVAGEICLATVGTSGNAKAGSHSLPPSEFLRNFHMNAPFRCTTTHTAPYPLRREASLPSRRGREQ